MKRTEEGGTANKETGVSGRGQAVRGQSIRDVAARLEAEVSEHHGDEALVVAVLMAAFVLDEDRSGCADRCLHIPPGRRTPLGPSPLGAQGRGGR